MNPNHGPVELRAAPIDEVNYPARTITLIAAPYDEWTEVEHDGAVIEESIAPGAFGAVRNRARKFVVNLEHDPERRVGSVLDLVPDDPRGLVATVKIQRSDAGDQALKDADDELLGASIGMAVGPGGQMLEGGRRRIVRAFLDHIALTWTPAYLGARSLEVRHRPHVVAPSSTPNLDRILAERAAAAYDRR